jgi:endonuclease I
MRKRYSLLISLLFLLAGCSTAGNQTVLNPSSSLSASSLLSASSPASSPVASPSSASPADGAQFPAAFNEEQKKYYAGVEGLKGQALFDKLHLIINKNFAAKTYGEAREALKLLDRDPDNPLNVIEIYTQNSVDKDMNLFNGNTAGYWNREHCYPKARMGLAKVGNSDTGRGADFHMLHASDSNVNGKRGSLNYYQFTAKESFTTDIPTLQKDSFGQAITSKCRYNPSLGFEPLDGGKGDCARAVFYMEVMYGSAVCGLSNTASQSAANDLGQLKFLVSWNTLDPVSRLEVNRNELIYTDYQKNRNPFIDAPEWVNLIWDGNGIIG